MIDSVRLAMAALYSREPDADSGLQVVPVDGADSLIGLDNEGRLHLFIPSPGEGHHPPDPSLVALSVGVKSLTMDGESRDFISVRCELESVADVFEHFATSVLSEIAMGKDAASVIAGVLDRWKRFLAEPKLALSVDRLTAIFGELLVARDLAIGSDPSVGLRVWAGPSGSRHDFRSGSTAIEVKTTRSHTSYLVRIHGVDQLEAPESGELYLHFVRLERDQHAGRSVTDLVNELIDLGADHELLFDALTGAGLSVTGLPEAGKTTFEVLERMTLAVGDDFPRIVSASFVDGAMPPGVKDLSYQVDLDEARSGALDAREFERLLSRVREGSHG